MENPNQRDGVENESFDFSDAEIAVLTRRLREDPAAARAFAFLQKQGYEVLRRLAREVMAKLAAFEPEQKVADASTDWKRYVGQARQRTNASRERRELAQDLVLGAFLNLDNPDWDPLDPSTCKDPASSNLLALLNPRLADTKNDSAK